MICFSRLQFSIEQGLQENRKLENELRQTKERYEIMSEKMENNIRELRFKMNELRVIK